MKVDLKYVLNTIYPMVSNILNVIKHNYKYFHRFFLSRLHFTVREHSNPLPIFQAFSRCRDLWYSPDHLISIEIRCSLISGSVKQTAASLPWKWNMQQFLLPILIYIPSLINIVIVFVLLLLTIFIVYLYLVFISY